MRAAYAAAQLVELGKAEAVGAIDEDSVRAGDVQAVFDNRGGYEDVGFVADEFQHYSFQLFFTHLAVGNHDAGLRDELRHQRGERINGFDAVVDEIDLAVAGHFVFDCAADQLFAKGRHRGLNRQAVARGSFDQRHIAEADQRHVEGARNGGRGEGQRVYVLAHFFQALFVRHAEALFFVHDQQAEVLELYVLR